VGLRYCDSRIFVNLPRQLLLSDYAIQDLDWEKTFKEKIFLPTGDSWNAVAILSPDNTTKPQIVR
jgi:hypothetical protein